MLHNPDKWGTWYEKQIKPGDMFRASFDNLFNDGKYKIGRFMVVAIVPGGRFWPFTDHWQAVIRRLSDGRECRICVRWIADLVFEYRNKEKRFNEQI